MEITQSRRDFLACASLAAAAAALGSRGSLADERAPETNSVRIAKSTGICQAPAYIADELLRAEGFTDIRYVSASGGFNFAQMAGRGEVDFGVSFAASVVFHLDAGLPITALAGVHSGCYELFANGPIRTITDLKGKRAGIQTLSSSGHLYMAIMAAQVGLDPLKDINWVVPPEGNAMELFAAGEVDAFLGFPPEPQELRDRKVGRVILATATDLPWSQYICCILFGSREFVRDYPVATKRFLRAILKAADLCASDPETAAQRVVDGGFTPRLDYALQALSEIPYTNWREFDPEDSMRFYALRLHEVGMIKSTPNQIIADGTDWRFLNELKRELKT
jgi:NitT/TauT family transport system substrate-binding protein